jgi:hypothetical protein
VSSVSVIVSRARADLRSLAKSFEKQIGAMPVSHAPRRRVDFEAGMERPLVSVVIPCHNMERNLTQTLHYAPSSNRPMRI